MPPTNRSNNSKKILIGGITLLLILVAVFSFLNRSPDKLQEGQLLIKAGDNRLARLTVADLRKLPAVEIKTIINSSRGKSEHLFTCTELAPILQNIDPQLSTEYRRVTTRGIDNYTSALAMKEVLQPGNVFIAYADGGKPLKTKTGQDGSLQIIVTSDEFGQRCTNYLVSIELE